MAKKIMCPSCKRRIVDVMKPTNESVTLRMKCPHCKLIVMVEVYLFARHNMKTK